MKNLLPFKRVLACAIMAMTAFVGASADDSPADAFQLEAQGATKVEFGYICPSGKSPSTIPSIYVFKNEDMVFTINGDFGYQYNDPDGSLIMMCYMSTIEVETGDDLRFVASEENTNSDIKMFVTYADGADKTVEFIYSGDPESFTNDENFMDGLAELKLVKRLDAPTCSTAANREVDPVYYGSISMFLSAEDGSTIYYTIDGSEPTTESKVYRDGYGLDFSKGSHVIKAIAVKDGRTSECATTTFEVRTATLKITNIPEEYEGWKVRITRGSYDTDEAQGRVIFAETDYTSLAAYKPYINTWSQQFSIMSQGITLYTVKDNSIVVEGINAYKKSYFDVVLFEDFAQGREMVGYCTELTEADEEDTFNVDGLGELLVGSRMGKDMDEEVEESVIAELMGDSKFEGGNGEIFADGGHIYFTNVEGETTLLSEKYYKDGDDYVVVYDIPYIYSYLGCECRFKIEKGALTSIVRRESLDRWIYEPMTTELDAETAEADDKDVIKIVENGKVIIIRDGKKFDLMGRKIE